ncbi:MAG: Hsp70 family protein, partial [Mycobacteriales bacterium]
MGIDLGTTYSVVAAVDVSGAPRVLPNREGGYLTPSVVFFDGEDAVVGADAAAAALTQPADCVELVKRSIGDANWRCVTARGLSYSAEEISAMLLRRITADAARQLGSPCSEVVITVPAYFDDARRRATADAGIIAGLDVLAIVNEPTAAALAYGFGEAAGGSRAPVTLLVYDWGGGTFDVTVVRISGDDYTVLATAGDRNLGGFDIDNALM